MSNKKVTYIEVSVGQLPDWYLEDEEYYDGFLETAIKRHWHKNPEFEDAEIAVSYNYQTSAAFVKAYDDDGNPVFERDDHEYGYALQAAMDEIW